MAVQGVTSTNRDPVAELVSALQDATAAAAAATAAAGVATTAANAAAAAASALSARTITAGTGLVGGGSLAADRTISLDPNATLDGGIP